MIPPTHVMVPLVWLERLLAHYYSTSPLLPPDPSIPVAPPPTIEGVGTDGHRVDAPMRAEVDLRDPMMDPEKYEFLGSLGYTPPVQE